MLPQSVWSVGAIQVMPSGAALIALHDGRLLRTADNFETCGWVMPVECVGDIDAVGASLLSRAASTRRPDGRDTPPDASDARVEFHAASAFAGSRYPTVCTFAAQKYSIYTRTQEHSTYTLLYSSARGGAGLLRQYLHFCTSKASELSTCGIFLFFRAGYVFKSDKQGLGYYLDALSADIWQPFDAAGDVAASAGASYCRFKSMRRVCPQTGTDTASLRAGVSCVLLQARPPASLRACVSCVPKSALTRLAARCCLLHCSAAAAVLPSCRFKRMSHMCLNRH